MAKATVAAIICPDEKQTGTVLLTRRNVTPFKGRWCLPGGHIDDYETAEEAVTREVFEETGLHFTDASFLDYYNEVFPEYRFHAVALAFYGIGRGSLMLMPEEVTEIAWFPIQDAISQPLAFNHLQILQRYEKHLGH